MPKKEILKKTTEHKIGKVTYLVSASPSDRATETIEKKLAKMIRKEVVQSAENAAFGPSAAKTSRQAAQYAV